MTVTLNKNGRLVPKAPRSNKNRNVIIPFVKKKIVKEELETLGHGIILPSDPNALCEQLELLMASKQAEDKGLRNEIVSICDELLRQKILSRDAYKNLMTTLNQRFLTGGTRTPWGYEALKQGVRSTKTRGTKH